MAHSCGVNSTEEAPPATRRREYLAEQGVFLLGLIALLVGLYVLRDTSIAVGKNPSELFSAVVSQLPLTLPAALLMLAATALAVCAGAVAMRFVTGIPYESLAQATLAGLVGAVLITVALMATVGLLGWFNLALLAIVFIGLLVAGLTARPFFNTDGAELRDLIRLPPLGPIGWLLVVVVWSGPVILALASPVVPSNDVPPNHVAPVEHLRTFGSLSSLDQTFSPIYGPSRIFLGYQAVVGALSTLTDVPGVTAVAEFAIPLAVLVAVSVSALAGAIGGRRAAAWALLLVPITVTFLRLGDARAAVLGFPLAALALWLTFEPLGSTDRRRALMLLLTLAAATFVHPLLGLMASAAVGLAGLLWARKYASYALVAAICAPLIASPQWAAMLGIDWAAATVLITWPIAALLFMVLTRVSFERLAHTWVAVAAVAAGLAIGALAVVAFDYEALGRVMSGAAALLTDYSVLLLCGVLGLITAARRPGFDLLVAGVIAGLIAGCLALALPGSTQLIQSAQYEVPKSVTYFAPTLLAITGAVGIALIWSRTSLNIAIRFAIASVLIVAAAAPLRQGGVDPYSLGEHRLSEGLSISMGRAARGYWQGYPDQRLLIDDEQRELNAALRAEVAAGRLGGSTNVLHVAQTWRSDQSPSYTTPLGVFVGVVETMATTDPENSIHTAGGRLMDINDLDSMLGPDHPYVVVEGDGLPGDTISQVEAAGYTQIFVNEKATVYALPR